MFLVSEPLPKIEIRLARNFAFNTSKNRL